jgi:hypothetical protein
MVPPSKISLYSSSLLFFCALALQPAIQFHFPLNTCPTVILLKNIIHVLKEWALGLDWIRLSGSVLFLLWVPVNTVLNICVPVIGRRYVEHLKDYQIPKSDGAQKISLFI